MKRKIPSLDKPVPRHRPVSPDETELWRKTLGEPDIRCEPDAELLLPDDAEEPVKASSPPGKRLRKPAKPVPAPVIDSPTRAKLRRGTLAVEATLDLHGHTRETAHAVLARFIAQAQARGVRLALVITGKGRAGGVGTLRQMLPRWLDESPIAPLVLAYGPAHARHGGDGAWYVRLRTHAKNAVAKGRDAVT